MIHGLHVLRVAGRDLIACGAEGSVTVNDAADGAQRYRLLEGGWAPVSAGLCVLDLTSTDRLTPT